MLMVRENANEKSVPPYRKGEFFKALPAAALADLEPLLFPTSHPANIVLFTETQPAAGIDVVLEGEVKLSINSSDGRRLSFHIAKAGEVLGLSSTLSGGAYEMTADTLYPAKIAHISRQVFLQFLTRHPEAYQTVTRDMAAASTLPASNCAWWACLPRCPNGWPACCWCGATSPARIRDRRALPPVDHARRDRRVYRRLARNRYAHAEHLSRIATWWRSTDARSLFPAAMLWRATHAV